MENKRETVSLTNMKVLSGNNGLWSPVSGKNVFFVIVL